MRTTGNVIDVMDALRASLNQSGKSLASEESTANPGQKTGQGQDGRKAQG